MTSKSVYKQYVPTSRWMAVALAHAWFKKPNNSGHLFSGTSIRAIDEMTRAVEWRTISLLKRKKMFSLLIYISAFTLKLYCCSFKTICNSWARISICASSGISCHFFEIRFLNSTAASWRTGWWGERLIIWTKAGIQFADT